MASPQVSLWVNIRHWFQLDMIRPVCMAQKLSPSACWNRVGCRQTQLAESPSGKDSVAIGFMAVSSGSQHRRAGPVCRHFTVLGNVFCWKSAETFCVGCGEASNPSLPPRLVLLVRVTSLNWEMVRGHQLAIVVDPGIWSACTEWTCKIAMGNWTLG